MSLLEVSGEKRIRLDFVAIYMMVLVVLGLCLVSMIRRIRGLSEYFEEGH
jgi:hypothetical protein